MWSAVAVGLEISGLFSSSLVVIVMEISDSISFIFPQIVIGFYFYNATETGSLKKGKIFK